MLFGYDTIKKIRQIEECAAALGFKVTAPELYYSGRDFATLRPLNDELPSYSRDATMFTGTFQEIDVWLRGVEWNKQYLINIIKVTTDATIDKKENQVRQQQLLDMIKSGTDSSPK